MQASQAGGINEKTPWPTTFQLPTLFASAMEYSIDAAQRSVLFLDVLRQRGNQFAEHADETVPHVLDYQIELVLDGRQFEHPVNYGLVRIVPPAGLEPDTMRRPFVVVDPRAGHGPGIGGFKADSEIGVALRAGHPCYFVGFTPDPVPGQTIEHIALAEARFLEKVIALHPGAEDKPCVIGNCQAGWAIMMVAAVRPELFGPLIIAGSPLSYWAGIHGQYPMRYSGGLLGGSWLTALVGDLGSGKFDGAWLVQNFENQNPANTLWQKPYNLYSKIDTEAERYLKFERWWGGHTLLNAEEIQFIVDELFIGNKLAAAMIRNSDGVAVDLRNIRTPIVVFCSKGDNVTPPQQALGWILDLYEDVDEIRSYGQTVVYTIHETIGHLGIFVSGGVAKKQHEEFSSNIDVIDTLPPGLYEAVFEEKTDVTNNPDLAHGNWVMRCEARSLSDIRALGGNDLADDRRFAAAAELSQRNLALYRAFWQPFVRACTNPSTAELLRRWHPLRLQYEMFSDANPAVVAARGLAETVRANRRPVAADNPFLVTQERLSDAIVTALDTWRVSAERIAETTFLTLYGSPMLQGFLGIEQKPKRPFRKPSKNLLHRALLDRRIAELRDRVTVGGLREAIIRGLLFAGAARAAVDERGFEAVRRIRLSQSDMSLRTFKALVREQFNILLLDTDAALDAIPAMLPKDRETRSMAFNLIRTALSARSVPSGEDKARLDRLAQLFGVHIALPRSAGTDAGLADLAIPAE